MESFSENAIQILQDRYLLRGVEGKIIETPEQLFRRVANFVARCETSNKDFWESEFYSALRRFEFLPNSPTLMNAGCKDGQLSACFVLPIEDNLESIFTTLKNSALIHQSGGGTGFNFSKISSKDDTVNTNGVASSGPLDFMTIYDIATECVKQGGKRRGANMAVLNVNHPDIEAFITSKSNKKVLSNFNISIGISDEYMHALETNSDWQLIDPRTKKVKETFKAKRLWDLMISEAWTTGDPGLIFLDTINRDNPTPKLGKIECTNPCGEVPLLDYESCNLGSVNLSKCLTIKDNKPELDWEKLKAIVRLGIRFLDNIISSNYYVLPEIKQITLANRKIGLGVMGWAELLILLEIPYDSDKAVGLAKKTMSFIKDESYSASRDLALERGAFPEWENSIYNSHQLLRNATCNSIAPTGTISIIANTSYSIEPLFALAYKRVGILGGKTQVEINAAFKTKMRALNLWDNALEREVLKTGSIAHINAIPEDLKSIFKTSLEIPWQYHLWHQQAFQNYTDNAVSKTINLPELSTIQDVSEIFKTSWKLKLKGITIYRYGSREQQVLRVCTRNHQTTCD